MTFFRPIRILIVYLSFVLSWLSADEENIERVFRVLTKLPEWNESNVSLHALGGGLSNLNYRAHVGANDYFVRCGFQHNSVLGVSLDREWQSASLASRAGLAPKTVFYNREEGIFITRFIDTREINVDLRDLTSQQKFCNLVRSLHELEIEFTTEFSAFDSIQHYIENAQEINAKLPDVLYDKIMPWIEQLKTSLKPLCKKVPCHFDLHHGNVLDDGERMWLIDWEYAGMGDPYFDLASAASIEDFSDREMQTFLETYLNERCPNQEEISYFTYMRILADVRWALWCYLQAKISPLDQPFAPFGDFFIQNALNRMSL